MTSTILEQALSSDLETKEEVSTVSGICDSCGSKAAHVATKGKLKLNFCGHHARHNAASLLERGFVISPDTYRF